MQRKILKIEKLDHQGRGIGFVDGKITFVPYALPNETVEIEVIKEKKKFYEAQLCHILEVSKDRTKSECPYYYDCGGCDLMHIDPANQVKFKRNKVKEIMEKFADIPSEVIQPIVSCDELLFYRNKTTFQIGNEIGFYEKKSNTLIPVKACMISDTRINEILKCIESDIQLQSLKQVMIRASKHTDDLMIVFDLKERIDEKQVISLLKDKVTSIFFHMNQEYQLIYGKEKNEEILKGKSFLIAPDAFFQVNTNQTEKLYQQVLDACDLNEKQIVLDLYCGTGTIGILIAPFVKKVIGVEINHQAIESAKENQKLNQVDNIEWYCDKVEHVLPKLKEIPDIVVVDPPRSGLDEKTIQALLKWKLNTIIYVSCDPMTLARDLKQLKTIYQVNRFTPVDMFPQTAHVECVAVLGLKDEKKSKNQVNNF